MLRFGPCSWCSAEGCFFLFFPLSFASRARAPAAVVRGAGKGASAGRATADGQGCVRSGRRTQGQPEKKGCARNASSPCRVPLPVLGGRLHIPPGSATSLASPRRDGGTPRRPENPPPARARARARARSVGAAGLGAARSMRWDRVPGADPALPWSAVRSSAAAVKAGCSPSPSLLAADPQTGGPLGARRGGFGKRRPPRREARFPGKSSPRSLPPAARLPWLIRALVLCPDASRVHRETLHRRVVRPGERALQAPRNAAADRCPAVAEG